MLSRNLFCKNRQTPDLCKAQQLWDLSLRPWYNQNGFGILAFFVIGKPSIVVSLSITWF